MRRIFTHKISIFVPRPRDVAHPGSGPAQDWLRIAQALLAFAHPQYHFRQAAAQHVELLQF